MVNQRRRGEERREEGRGEEENKAQEVKKKRGRRKMTQDLATISSASQSCRYMNIKADLLTDKQDGMSETERDLGGNEEAEDSENYCTRISFQRSREKEGKAEDEQPSDCFGK